MNLYEKGKSGGTDRHFISVVKKVLRFGPLVLLIRETKYEKEYLKMMINYFDIVFNCETIIWKDNLVAFREMVSVLIRRAA